MTMASFMVINKKDLKIELRVSSAELELIDRAAELRAEKRSQYVRQRVLRAASRTVLKAQRLSLGVKDFDRLQAALEEPVRPKPRLKRLLAEPSVFGE